MENSPSCLDPPSNLLGNDSIRQKIIILRTPYGNFIRILRLLHCLSRFLHLLFILPLQTFHVGMIPPDLLMAIAGSRERVPFPL